MHTSWARAALDVAYRSLIATLQLLGVALIAAVLGGLVLGGMWLYGNPYSAWWDTATQIASTTPVRILAGAVLIGWVSANMIDELIGDPRASSF